MKKTILVQKNSNGRIKFIELTLDGDTVSRKWGLIGGKSQKTSNTYDYINKGKKNQLNPIQSAEADYYRIIDTKIKEGHLITKSLHELPDFDNEQMDFNNLPVQLCCSKPNTKVTEKKANLLLKKLKGKYFLKYNGLCHFILITSTKEVKIYTRRMDDHTIKYPSIVESVKKLNLAPNSLLITEFIIDPDLNIPHMEGFKLMSSISRSDTLKGKVKNNITQTLKLQEKHPVKVVVFNVLFYNNKDLTTLPYNNIINDYFNTIGLYNDIQNKLIAPISMKFDSHKDAVKWVNENSFQYEGLVLWDLFANAEISYSGKPKRRACYKVKSIKEADVIAFSYNEGDGDKQGLIGSLNIGKYDDKGNIINLGKCGSGLTDDMVDPKNWQFPCVIEIKYDQRFPTGRFQFARYVKLHEDKIPADIVIDKNGM